jgi:hypothetical protein
MPTAASAALRAAVHDALIADTALVNVLGGPKIYDEPPRAAAFPYVTLGETRIGDYSAGTEPGAEHQTDLACLVAPGRPQGGACDRRRAAQRA